MRMDLDQIISISYGSSSHRYIQPHPYLRKDIAHYTILLNQHMIQQELLLIPDASGCMIMRFYPTLQCTLWGPTTQVALVKSEPHVDPVIFFIEFHPLGSYHLLQHPPLEIRDRRIALEQCFPLLEQTFQYIFETSDTLSTFIKRIEQCLLSLNMEPGSSFVQSLRQEIHKQQGRGSLQAILENFGYSIRHCQRLFQEQMGLNMKTYARMERINFAVTKIKQEPHRSLTQLAYQCGYFDQAHFVHDFSMICNVTPRQFQMRMSEFYNEIYKF